MGSFADDTMIGGEGNDTFIYTISDGNGGTDTGTVTITLNGTNDDPTVSNVATAADEDGAAVTASFAGDDVDSDDDGTTLTYAISSAPTSRSPSTARSATRDATRASAPIPSQ